MYFTQKRMVPINRCRHAVHRFPGACDIIEVDSGGLPIDLPEQPASRSNNVAKGLLRCLEVFFAFASGVAAACSWRSVIVRVG